MKQYLLNSLMIFLFLTLVGCTATRAPTLHSDLTQETWMRSIEHDPMSWTRGADRWFMTGGPNKVELENRHAPAADVMSTMMVRAPHFTRIESNGDFQVQIFGTYAENSVYIYGPNKDVREVVVTVRGDTLCITQTKQASSVMQRVIVRIGMNQFKQLRQLGRGCIEGIQLHSAGLNIISAGRGNLYLAGDMNVQYIQNKGTGSINVFGANSRALDITTMGYGDVNVSGNVGLRRIMHYGANNINIIGANSAALTIYAEGSGKIGINGPVNLCNVTAKNNTCVYMNAVNSGNLYACVYDRARVGVAGHAYRLSAETYHDARFYGRYLCTQEAFARAHDASHINVTATQKIFAAATQNASIYFFGSPSVLTQFLSGNGTVMPIWYDNMRVCPMVMLAAPVYKRDYKGEAAYYVSHPVRRQSRSGRYR
jgi:hypothetical protein